MRVSPLPHIRGIFKAVDHLFFSFDLSVHLGVQNRYLISSGISFRISAQALPLLAL